MRTKPLTANEKYIFTEVLFHLNSKQTKRKEDISENAERPLTLFSLMSSNKKSSAQNK